jgi:hypothetical protein
VPAAPNGLELPFLVARFVPGDDRVPGLSGLAYFVQGWVLGSEGFSATDTIAILAGNIPMLVWTIWLVVVARRTKESVRAPTR